MDKTLFFVIIIILLADFFLERFLNYLNLRNWSPVVPDELLSICSPDEYEKSRKYFLANHNFDLLSSAFTTPFDLYHTFVIEKRFGFNKTTPKIYILDKLKGWLLAVIVGGGLMALIIWIYRASGEYFWLLAWGVITFSLVFVTYFYSSLIVPLFNKQKPLEEGELRTAIEDFGKKVDFRIKNIFVMDASKRSTKGNAYFSGFGHSKRIVLFDTLIEKHSVDELVAVLAHEIGHYKKKHVTTGMLIAIAQTGFTLWLLSRFIGSPDLSAALGGKQASFHMGLIGFFILYSPVSLILGLLSNIISRKNEFAADKFAAIHDDPDHLVVALSKLSTDNLSNLNPHRAYVFFHYSHPPLLQRIKALRLVNNQESKHGH